MKTNRHQLEIAGDRIGQAAGALAKAIAVMNKYGLADEGAEVCKMVGKLGDISVAIHTKFKAMNSEGSTFVAGDIGQKPIAKPVAAEPVSTQAVPAEAPKVETTADGDKVPA